MAASKNVEIINKSVFRRIDVTSNVAKITTVYTAVNANDYYDVLLPKKTAERLALLVAVVDEVKVELIEIPSEYENYIAYRINIPQNAVESHEVTTEAVFTDVLEPYPSEIYQTENQYVLFTDSAYVPSPYMSLIQETGVMLTSQSPIEYHDGLQPIRLNGKNVLFGPYSNISSSESIDQNIPNLSVRYANHAAFAKVSTFLREIEVSHWGNVAVEEFYEVEHHGAKLKGGFSRVDYTSKRGKDMPESPSFRRFLADLPPNAHSIYYRDNIGNISTSAVFQSNPTDPKIFVMDTRYPLYGGWKIAWYQGYNIPAEDVLTRSNGATNDYTLSMNFGMPFSEFWAEEFRIKIILPEGCSGILVEVPYDVSLSDTRRFTYLDSPIMGGRPVITLDKRNVVSDHSSQFTVHYKFYRHFMLHEPLLLVAAYFAFFLMCMVATRFHQSNSIGKECEAKKNN